jgi:hypothetical protein
MGENIPFLIWVLIILNDTSVERFFDKMIGYVTGFLLAQEWHYHPMIEPVIPAKAEIQRFSS